MVSELGSMQGLESIIDRKHEWKTLIRQYRIMKIPITYKMFPSFSITRLSALNQTPNNVKLSEEILLHISSPMLKVTNLFIFSANYMSRTRVFALLFVVVCIDPSPLLTGLVINL